jgi:hypothetical protein
MNILELQAAVGAKVDGFWGDKSRKALLASFTNLAPPKLTSTDEARFATRLGVGVKQLRAVAAVESSGGGYDKSGKPKILYERHKFHRFTGGKWSVSTFSNSAGGGYNESSWDKLLGAVAVGDVDAAFMSCSWGKFQVLGEYWSDFGYASPFALAFSTVPSEAGHYELLCHYIEENHLADEMALLSSDPEKCRPFARAYNGKGYEQFKYHTKLAAAMA